MKKNIKKSYVILAIVITMSLAVFSGCRNKEDKVSQNNQSEEDTNLPADDNTSEDPDNTGDADSGKEPAGSDTPEVPETKEVLLYGIQNDTLESEQVTVAVPKESKITAEFIVSQVVDVFADDSIEIGIDSVTEEGDKVIVSFLKDKAPLAKVGSGVELTILDSISMSLLDNLDTCKNVIFRVEGNAYASGHIELDKDEVYKWK